VRSICVNVSEFVIVFGEFLALIRDIIIFVVRRSRLSSSGSARASYRMLSIGVVLNAQRAVKAVFIVDFTFRNVVCGQYP